MEGAQHPGDVAQCAALDAALAQRPRRLPFEVDDDEVVAGMQHLPEVIVAVRADAQAGDAAVENAPDPLLDFFFARQQLFRGRNSLSAAPQELKCAHCLRTDVLINRPLIMRRNRLGSECRNVVARREREMHLRRTAPEDFGVGEIEADRLLRNRRHRFVGNREQRFQRRSFREPFRGSWIAENSVEETPKGIDGVRPRVAGIRHIPLQDRQRGRLRRPLGLILQRAG